MKKIVSAFAVLAIVGSALAFKPFGQGNVFCSVTACQTLTSSILLDNINGTPLNPCGATTFIQKSGSNCNTVNYIPQTHKFRTVPQ